MKIFLLDIAETRSQLLPITYTRSIGEIRVGILQIHEKWTHYLSEKASFITEPYLGRFPSENLVEECLVINASLCPSLALVEAVLRLSVGEKLVQEGVFLAARCTESPTYGSEVAPKGKKIHFQGDLTRINRPWDIFIKNGDQIRADFDLITKGRKSAPLNDPFTRVYNSDQVFLEEGADVKAAILNAENGPIYIGRYAKVLEGAIIRGPFAMGEFAQVSMGAKVRGDSTFGPHCKVGGEIGNSVIMGYSNKGHEGYLGNSVIGEWCNMGADTNTSNLKNNYTQVKVWDYSNDAFGETGLQFCGLVMGDHSRCGINTMFNTGTSVGMATNVYGAGYPPGMIPSFSWGGKEAFTTYDLEKAKQTAAIAMRRKTKEWSTQDDTIFEEVYRRSKPYRSWENKAKT